MNKILLVPALAAILAVPALAEPVTKTVTIDRPNIDGTRTITRDKEAGTLSVDTQVTRASDGATASSIKAGMSVGFSATSAPPWDTSSRSSIRRSMASPHCLIAST